MPSLRTAFGLFMVSVDIGAGAWLLINDQPLFAMGFFSVGLGLLCLVAFSALKKEI